MLLATGSGNVVELLIGGQLNRRPWYNAWRKLNVDSKN